MKLPSINSAQVVAAPPTKLDIRFGKLDPDKCLLMATWEPPRQDEKGWVRYGKPTATWWRAWKLRKKSLFAAGLKPITTDDGFKIEWRSKTPFPSAAMPAATKPAKRASRAVLGARTVRLRNTRGLKSWQPEAVARHLHALEQHGGTVDASTTGVGKTFIALATCRELGWQPQIVCPKNIISGWEEAAAMLKVPIDFVTNYEQLTVGSSMLDRVARDGRNFQWARPRKKVMTIFDEAHRLKTPDSLHSHLALAARAAGIPVMLLSATLAQDPTELYTTGLLLGLHKGDTDFHRWAQEYGCAFDGMGLVWRGDGDDIKRLHRDLFPEHGSRIRARDIDEFPDSLVIAKSLDCENADELQAIYDEMELEMARHEEKRERDGMKILNALCAMTRARQHAELLKVPMIVDFVRELVAEGNSVPVFVNYTDTLEAVAERLGTDCIIRGGQTKKVRDAMQARFQSNRDPIIVCQIRAGGESISLHDLHGGHPRASVISPSFSAREVVQACGRCPRTGAKQDKVLQYILFAHGTIEDAACRCVARKAGNIETLNDGDLAAGFFSTSKK